MSIEVFCPFFDWVVCIFLLLSSMSCLYNFSILSFPSSVRCDLFHLPRSHSEDDVKQSGRQLILRMLLEEEIKLCCPSHWAPGLLVIIAWLYLSQPTHLAKLNTVSPVGPHKVLKCLCLWTPSIWDSLLYIRIKWLVANLTVTLRGMLPNEVATNCMAVERLKCGWS